MGRKEFSLPGLFFVMLPIPVSIFLLIFSGVYDQELLVFVVIPILFLVLFFFAPIITKRLHDIGMSGWFNLILYITAPAIFYFYVGFVLFIIDFAITFGNTDTLLILSLIHI